MNPLASVRQSLHHLWRRLHAEQSQQHKADLAALQERLDRNERRRSKELMSALDGVTKELRTSLQKVEKTVAAAVARQQRTHRMVRELAEQQAALRLMMRAGRSPNSDDRADDRTLGSVIIPLEPAHVPSDAAGPKTRPAIPAGGALIEPIDMVALDACPVCGGAERTPVCEYNRLVLLDADVDEGLKRYDYSVCHSCGVTYAVRRPVGRTYQEIFARFEDTLGRATPDQATAFMPILSPTPLSPEEKVRLERRLKGGVFVSEHLEIRRSDYLPHLLRDRLSNSVHLEILSSLLTLDRPRVLEIRPRFGAIGAGLQRLFHADVSALPMTDTQRFIMREAYGIDASSLVDFDAFDIPFDGTFDLVVANHMMTHAVWPSRFLKTVASRLTPGGHLYLYNEPDDAEFLEGTASMINTLNPFHLQAFDRRSLTRALQFNGFDPVFVTNHRGNFVYLARQTATPATPAFPEAERTARIEACRRARDLALLRMPASQHWRVRDEWQEAVERAVASGSAEFDAHARLRLVRPASRAED